jgi:hypothetical protein
MEVTFQKLVLLVSLLRKNTGSIKVPPSPRNKLLKIPWAPRSGIWIELN